MGEYSVISRAHISALIAEFVGTFILSLAVLTVSKSSLNLPFFISITAGLVAASVVLLFGRISGAHSNPAITLGLLSLKRITVLKAAAYIAAQFVGGLVAYYLFAYFSGQRWHNAGQFSVRLLVAETVGAFLFAIGWATVVFQKLESSRSAAIIGLSFTLALLVTSSAGVVMLNPALALGVRSWIWGSSVLGPIIGAVVGFQAYKYLFMLTSTPTKQVATEKVTARAATVPFPHAKSAR